MSGKKHIILICVIALLSCVTLLSGYSCLSACLTDDQCSTGETCVDGQCEALSTCQEVPQEHRLIFDGRDVLDSCADSVLDDFYCSSEGQMQTNRTVCKYGCVEGAKLGDYCAACGDDVCNGFEDQSICPQDCKTDVLYDMPVLSIAFIPPKADDPSLVDTSLMYDSPGATIAAARSRINTYNQRLADALTQASKYHGYKDPNAAPSLYYHIIEHKEFLQPIPNATTLPVFDIMDGDTKKIAWHIDDTKKGDYMIIDMFSAKEFDKITLYFYGGNRPLKFDVQASNTGKFKGEQVTILSEKNSLKGYTTNPEDTLASKIYTFPRISARYIKMIVDEPIQSDRVPTQTNLKEIAINAPVGIVAAHSNYRGPMGQADHRGILESIDICDYVDNKGVKQVWIWMYHSNTVAPVESFEAGQIHHFGNGYIDIPICNHTYFVSDYNTGREIGTMLENHGHHTEAMMTYVDSNFFEKWVGPQGPGKEPYGCGNIHCAPNEIANKVCGEYNWANQRTVLSNCQDWNPDGNGKKESVSCRTWANAYRDPDSGLHNGCAEDGGAAFKVWWWQNMPGRDNNLTYNGKCVRNFWEFFGDFDNAIAKGKSLTLPCN